MVLDLDLFRTEKGGDPEKIRESQRKRYKDPGLVDRVVNADVEWRKSRFYGDELNRLKKVCSKEVGERMKKKEAVGTDDTLPDRITKDLAKITPDILKPLTVIQIKKIVQTIDDEISKNSQRIITLEQDRFEALREIGNIVHDTVPVSDNEENNCVEKIFGDITLRKKYSQVDLGVMVDGYDGERGAITAGGRGYYLKVFGILRIEGC